ncbi:hypothetical protein CVT26_004964 [Gymnopilus dilepis]|uniref:F-box domain-containing protein n=1 Tax=Gymnopilus dilepis TaxID=231916 RepID=A0A409Y067_9AGAR|nr:hypothetical protein CVT26_004964 [Gymnopilus dilepis]
MFHKKRPQSECHALPEDVFFRVFTIMPMKSLIACRATCRTWRQLVPLSGLPSARRILLDFYFLAVNNCPRNKSSKFRTRRRKRVQSVGMEDPTRIDAIRRCFETIPDIFLHWIEEWPGRTALRYKSPLGLSGDYMDALRCVDYGIFELDLCLGDTRVGFARTTGIDPIWYKIGECSRFERSNIHLYSLPLNSVPRNFLSIPISTLIPRDPDVGTIDGFLATSHRIGCFGNFLRLLGYVERAAAEGPHHRQEAAEGLAVRMAPRMLARRFVSEIGWAPGDENEDAGLGMSNIAMDMGLPCGRNYDLAAALCDRYVGLEQFLKPRGPVPPQDKNGKNINDITAPEPMWWVARQWEHAGRPEASLEQVTLAMKAAFEGMNNIQNTV